MSYKVAHHFKLFQIEKCTNGKKCIFHSIIPLKNMQIFKGSVKCKTFDHSSLNQMKTFTKHVLSITHFHSCFFLTFSFKFCLYKKFKLSIKDYLLLIYMCLLLFLRIIILGFQSHQTRILSAGLGMAWNRYGLSCT